MGFIVCIMLLLVYYGSAAAGIYLVGAHTRILKISFADWTKIIGIAVGGMIFIAMSAKTQQAIYTFDSLQIWEPAIRCRDLIYSGVSIHDILKDFYISVNHYEKNNFLPMLMAIPLIFTGVEFPTFVTVGWLLFAVPSIFAISLCLDTFLAKMGVENNSIPLLMLIASIIPAYSIPMLWGYMNVAIMLTGATMFFLCLDMKLERLEYAKLVVLSALSVLAVIETRTAAYMVVGCFLGQTVLTIYRGIVESKLRRYLTVLFQGFLLIGILSGGFLFAVFNRFLMHSVFYDIKTAYSAYNVGATLGIKLLAAVEQLGLIIALLLFVSIVAGMFFKRFRGGIILAATWLISSIFLICRIQLIGSQHIYIALVPLTIILLTMLAMFCAKEQISKKIVGAAIAFLLVFNFSQCYFETIHIDFPLFMSHKIVLPVPTMQRYDINEVSQVTHALRKMSNDAKDKVYILASSGDVNPDAFNKVDFPRFTNTLSLAEIAHVDLRDGFPLAFLNTDIVAVADPIQTHLLPDDQSVIKLLAQAMLNDTQIAKHFKQEAEYKLHHDRIWASKDSDAPNELAIKIYRKTSPFSADDIDYLINLFNKRYAEHPELFENRLEQYKKEHFEKERPNE